MKKQIFPQEVDFLFKIFSGKKDSLRVVGGCVRDYLLNKKINDYDFATKYTPNEVKNILEKNKVSYFTTGEKFGTITAVINKKKFEITTLRKDIKTDGRHTTVEFTDNYREDAKRRDFTFNAIYMDANGKIYDFFEGRKDLMDRKIKFIGNAENRILEDNLRILRFFRFFSYCDDFEYQDFKNCVKYKYLIKNLSKERITSEFFKILAIKNSIKTLTIMNNYEILKEIFSKNLQLNNLEIFYYLTKFVDFKYDNLFVLAMIYSINGANYNFTLTNKEKKYIDYVIKYKFNINENFDFSVKKLLFECGDKKIAGDIVVLNFCNNYNSMVDFYNLIKCLDIVKSITIPKLKISGKELIKAGFKNKKDFGKIIEEIKKIYVNSNFILKLPEIIKMIKS